MDVTQNWVGYPLPERGWFMTANCSSDYTTWWASPYQRVVTKVMNKAGSESTTWVGFSLPKCGADPFPVEMKNQTWKLDKIQADNPGLGFCSVRCGQKVRTSTMTSKPPLLLLLFSSAIILPLFREIYRFQWRNSGGKI